MGMAVKRTGSGSPYLGDPNRLGDVIAAIQAMAVYKFYKLDFRGWADRISADDGQAEKWRAVFLEHPEFFRLDSKREKASLVWRRQLPRNYDVDGGRVLTDEEYDSLGAGERSRVSRSPLSSNDIKALIDTAVNLHARALEHEKKRLWWLPLFAAVASFLGAVVGAALKR